MGVLSKMESEKLYAAHPVVPVFHSFPKLHKFIFPPPMRPIVAGIGSMGERLGAWVDSFLQPLVDIMPSYIRDSKHVVMLLDGQE